MRSEAAKESARQRAREWHSNNREYANASRLLRYKQKRSCAIAPMRVERFGITPERYAEMFASQHGLCAGCCQPESQHRNGRRKFLAVDHDHTCCPGDFSCGVCVRQLLCANCNNTLGRMNDDPWLLLQLAQYVRQHEEGYVAIPLIPL